MLRKGLVLCFRVIFFGMVTYGVFYFSYKYFTPWLGGDDFARYYKMYLRPLDYSQAPAPFVLRQFSAVITNRLWSWGAYYPLEISFSDPAYDSRVFFGALLSNYIALLLTAVVVSMTVDHKTGRRLLIAPLVGGMLCFLSVFTQAGVLTGLTEGWSWFLVAVGFYGYLRRRLWIVLPVLLISILQRETIPVLFCAISLVDLLFSLRKGKPDPFQAGVFVLGLLSFFSYVMLRLLVVPVSGYESQLDMASMLSNVADSWPPNRELVIQGILSQNIYFVFLLVSVGSIFLRRNHGVSARGLLHDTYIVQVTCALLVLYVGGIAAGIGNNVGRMAANLTPITAALVARTMADLEVVAFAERT